METVTISLNGVEVSGVAGTTVLELAREVGVHIPTLCHNPHLTPAGACRICLVEEEKTGTLLASCVTPIAPGQVINTASPRVLENRKRILKLLLASHPDTCMVCDKGNSCTLRTLATEAGIGLIEYKKLPRRDSIEEVNPFIERDLTKCVLCGTCIRIDQELVVEGAIDYIERGAQARPATYGDQPLDRSECTFCGACVAACPTGALMEKDRVYAGTATATDTIICPYCDCGCSLSLQVKDGRVIRAFPAADAPVNGGSVCVRGSYGQDYVTHPDRLTAPLIRENGDFHEATWEKALAYIAEKISALRDTYGPDSLGVYGSSKCSNEENYLLQRFTRCLLGTNNIDNGSRLDSSPARSGLGATIGYAGSTGTLSGLERAEVILVAGADPEVSAPVVAYAIKRAVKYRGAVLGLIDPRQNGLSRYANVWLRPATGTDSVVLNGLARILVRERAQDVEFVSRRTDNFDTWAASLEPFTPVAVEERTGIPRKELHRMAHLMAGAREAAFVCGSGITRLPSGAAAVASVANLAMLTGNIGGNGGIYILQRENNAQGSCDMGTLPDFLPGYQSVTDETVRHRFGERWRCELPAEPGVTIFGMLRKAEVGRLKGMFIFGENPVGAFPRSLETEHPLSQLDLLVVSELFMTQTAALADIVLPAAGTVEKEGSYTNLEGRVQYSAAVLPPPGMCRTDGEMVLLLAEAMGVPMPFSSPGDVNNEIEEMVPFYRPVASADLDTAVMDITPSTMSPGNRRLHGGLFPAGFGRFAIAEFPPATGAYDVGFPLTLIAGAVRDHFGTGMRTEHASRLAVGHEEPGVLVNPADAREAGLWEGKRVRIVSTAGEVITIARISTDVLPGMVYCASTVHDNVINLFAPVIGGTTGTPLQKSCAVRLERINDDVKQNG